VVRTVHECLQSVLWNGTVGMMPPSHTAFPRASRCGHLDRHAPSDLVIAWNSADSSPLIRSFVRIAETLCPPARTLTYHRVVGTRLRRLNRPLTAGPRGTGSRLNRGCERVHHVPPTQPWPGTG
jgi:hypothetical protein